MTAASYQHMLQISCQQGTSLGVQRSDNHWVLGEDGTVTSQKVWLAVSGPVKLSLWTP